jgi:hypothetical protein
MKTLAKLALVLGVVMVFSTCALATLVDPNAQFGFVGGGGTTYLFSSYSSPYPGSPSSPVQDADLLTAASILIPGNAGNGVEVINELPMLYLGIQNDFASGGLTPLSLFSGVTFSDSGAYSSDNGYLLDLTPSDGILPMIIFGSTSQYEFVATSEIVQRSGSGGGSQDLTLYYAGTFYDNSGSPVYNTTPASVTFAFTQDSPAASPNFSGSFADPPGAPPGVPEPATMCLFGSSLVGLALLWRRRRA